MQVNSHKEIILALGGPSKLARALRCQPQRVIMWNVRGRIPPTDWGAIVDVCTAEGLDVSLSMLQRGYVSRNVAKNQEVGREADAG